MFRVEDLSIGFAIVVAGIFAGIGTGYFERGPASGIAVSAPAPTPPPMPGAPPIPPPPQVAPPAPVPPPAPAPAPAPLPGAVPSAAVSPGDFVDGTLKTWCSFTGKPRTDNPASSFRLTILGSGQAQFRPGSATGGGAIMPGTYDPATGKAQGRYDWPDGPAYTRWSATLTKRNGTLEVTGLACSAPKTPDGTRCGGWFWGPATAPETKTADIDPSCG